MNSLLRVVEQILDKKDRLGGTLSDTATKALEQQRKQLFMGFVVIEFMLIAIIMFSAYGIATSIEDQARVAAFTGAMGITVGGAVELMRRVWREWSRIGLLMILLEDASEGQIESILEQLKKKL